MTKQTAQSGTRYCVGSKRANWFLDNEQVFGTNYLNNGTEYQIESIGGELRRLDWDGNQFYQHNTDMSYENQQPVVLNWGNQRNIFRVDGVLRNYVSPRFTCHPAFFDGWIEGLNYGIVHPYYGFREQLGTANSIVEGGGRTTTNRWLQEYSIDFSKYYQLEILPVEATIPAIRPIRDPSTLVETRLGGSTTLLFSDDTGSKTTELDPSGKTISIECVNAECPENTDCQCEHQNYICCFQKKGNYYKLIKVVQK